MRFLKDVSIAPNPGCDHSGRSTIKTRGQAWSTSAHNALGSDMLQVLKSWLTLDTRLTYK